MISMKPHHVIPALGGLCTVTTLALASTFLVPHFSEENDQEPRTKGVTAVSVERREIPGVNEVLSKHLFVPDRKAENMKSNADLVVRGVYIGEKESNLVLSLKSKPTVSLRVWEKDKDALIAKITDTKDPHYPLVAFLKEWDIKEITFGGVTFSNPLTGETEMYEVDYTPAKKVADNAISGYGQGGVLDLNSARSGSSTKAKRNTTTKQNAQKISQDTAKTINSRISGLMDRMSSKQRKQFAEAVNSASKKGTNSKQGNKNGKKKSANKK